MQFLQFLATFYMPLDYILVIEFLQGRYLTYYLSFYAILCVDILCVTNQFFLLN